MKENGKNSDVHNEPVIENTEFQTIETPTPGIHEGQEDTNKDQKKSLVHFQKEIIFDKESAGVIDETFVNAKFYNSFNYSLLSKEQSQGKMMLGIISPHKGDGKTIVASNLAVSFALAMEIEVVLVDLNFQNPRIHEVFPTRLSPGFLDSITEPTIRVVPTKIRNLSILTAGDVKGNVVRGFKLGIAAGGHNGKSFLSGIRLEQLGEFRNIILSLQKKFDLIIVDLPSVDESKALTMFMKQLDGIIIVINAGKTKKEDVDNLLLQINEHQVSGFVFNRAARDEA